MDITGLMFLIAAIAIAVVTAIAVRDVLRGERPGATFRRWLRRAADAFFSAP